MSVTTQITVEEIESLISSAHIISDDTSEYIDNKNQNNDESKQNKSKNSIQFKELKKHQQDNIELLLEINATIKVQLGKTTLKIRDILSLGEGSIIELNKPSHEPVDLIVNNQQIGQGEVVVIEENFGTRITKILNTEKRYQSLQSNDNQVYFTSP